ncbi:MAG: CsgG/HfaB family protein [Bacteroidales bacterium]
MKILRNISFLTLLALFATVIYASAQDAPKKEILIIDRFTQPGNIQSNYTQGVRNSVINSFTERGRFIVVDAAKDTRLQKLSQERTGEDAVNENNVLEESRSAAIKSTGAKYLVSGSVVTYGNKRTTKDGQTTYTSVLTFSLDGYIITTGEVVASKQYEVTGLGKTRTEADNNAIEAVKMKTTFFINENFTFTTSILQLEAAKKGKLKELYIHCGSGIGVQRGDIFMVYMEKDIAGINTLQEIGRLRAIEIAGEEVCKCTVTAGNKEISDAFNSQKKLVVRSAGVGGLNGLLMNLQ